MYHSAAQPQPNYCGVQGGSAPLAGPGQSPGGVRGEAPKTPNLVEPKFTLRPVFSGTPLPDNMLLVLCPRPRWGDDPPRPSQFFAGIRGHIWTPPWLQGDFSRITPGGDTAAKTEAAIHEDPVVRALAKARCWQTMLESGQAATLGDLAEKKK